MKRFTGLMIFAFFIAMVAKAEEPVGLKLIPPFIPSPKSIYSMVPSYIKGVRYYGYYLSGYDIFATADHSNFTHAYADGALETHLQEATDHNMKMMVDVSNIFFGGKNLKAGYQTEWNQLVIRLAGKTDKVVAFYMADEPNINDYSRADVQLAVNTVKASFPTIPTASFLDGESNYGKFVDLFDWVGIDCYDYGDKSCHMFKGFDGWPGLYWVFRTGLDVTRQRVMLIPQAGMPRKRANDNSNTYNYGLPEEADEYLDIALNDPLVIAVIPFIWHTFKNDRDDWYGAEALPATRNKFTEFGHTITERSEEQYPSQPSAISPALISVLITSILL